MAAAPTDAERVLAALRATPGDPDLERTYVELLLAARPAPAYEASAACDSCAALPACDSRFWVDGQPEPPPLVSPRVPLRRVDDPPWSASSLWQCDRCGTYYERHYFRDTGVIGPDDYTEERTRLDARAAKKRIATELDSPYRKLDIAERLALRAELAWVEARLARRPRR